MVPVKVFRLAKEITYWDRRAEELRQQEEAGKQPKLNSSLAYLRADSLQVRLDNRLRRLQEERRLSPAPPLIMGGALIIPAGLLARLGGKRHSKPPQFARETRWIELIGMAMVMKTERRLGNRPRDVSMDYVGYDIESLDPSTGHLRFIEVKGRISGADTVTVTRNEILTVLNKPEHFILAIVQVSASSDLEPGEDPHAIHDPKEEYGIPAGTDLRYITQPFTHEPDFGASSVNYKLNEMWERGIMPLKDGIAMV